VISGNPVLGAAAVAAGKRWKFQPFQADGKPAKTIVRVNFDFSK
jgi:outer membrane biosynthesis protein TonB